MIRKFLAVSMAVALTGCSGVDYRRTMRYALDTAQKVCEMSVVIDHEDPAQWCEIADNVFPFVEMMVESSKPAILPNPYKQVKED